MVDVKKIDGSTGSTPGAVGPITPISGDIIQDSFSGTDREQINGRLPDTIENGSRYIASPRANIQSDQMQLGDSAQDFCYIDLNTNSCDFAIEVFPGNTAHTLVFFISRSMDNLSGLPQEGYAFFIPFGGLQPAINIFRYRLGSANQLTLTTNNPADLTDLAAVYDFRFRNVVSTGTVQFYIGGALISEANDPDPKDNLWQLIGVRNLLDTDDSARFDNLSAISSEVLTMFILDNPDSTEIGAGWETIQ